MSSRKSVAKHRPYTRSRLWGWPVLLLLTGLTGLISALFSEGGWGDWFSWLALSALVAVMGWHWFGCRAD